MKLVTISDNYVSPNPTKGVFHNAYIRDFKKIIEDNRLTVLFGLYFLKNQREIKVDETALVFDANNKVAYFGVNPTVDADGNTTYEEIVDLIEFVESGGDLSTGVITDYGHPTYEFVKQLFDGGSIDDPEIHLTQHPLREVAKGFLLQNLFFEGEAIGNQFKFEIE